MGVLEAEPRAATTTAPAPTIVTPKDGASLDAAYATFEWEAVGGADGYRFQAADDGDFTKLIVDASVGEATSLTLFESFAPDGRERYARVEALDGSMRISMSAVRAFRPVMDTELEREQMPKKPVERRAPVTKAPATKTAATKARPTSEPEEPWRTGTTSGGLVAVLITLMATIIVLFGLMLLL